MSRTVIRIGLSEKSINEAIRTLELYRENFRKKVDTYRKRIADELAAQASQNFENSLLDDVIRGGSPRKPEVEVSVSDKGNISVVVADGEDAVWCEFGSGVYHNGSVGSSPHPQGSSLGFTIGSYGKGYGKGTAWGYYDEDDNLVITRGTPASMPMYNAAKEVTRIAVDVAREVFG